VWDNTLAVAITAACPDWHSVASLAVDAVSSQHSKRAYAKALKDFVVWYSAEPRPVFSRAVVQHYRSVVESAGLAPASINVRLSAIHKLAEEAAENGLLDRGVAQGIVSFKGVRQSGSRAGNWLTRQQARDLLARPGIETIEGKRDRAILCSAARLRTATERARGARMPTPPAARRRLGVRRLGGLGKQDPDGAHPALCQGCHRRLDGGGRFMGL
jgi:hypothetical protein